VSSKTLVLTVALPDFYAEDLSDKKAGEYGFDNLWEMLAEDSGLLSNVVNVLYLQGDRESTGCYETRGVILAAAVVNYEASHNELYDDRMTGYLESREILDA
jgi:hypothetical protein